MMKSELIEMLEDAYIKIDLQQETIDEQEEMIRVLKAQIALWHRDIKAPDLKAS